MVRFNSRTPCGVRLRMRHRHADQPSFNSRTPCGVRPGCHCNTWHPLTVSIHAPRAGCDFNIRYNASNNWVSIHAPRAGCDDSAFGYVPRYDVSIHAPRAGCDTVIVLLPSISSCFNSRTPCGVRHLSTLLSSSAKLFQFTHPVRGATAELRKYIGDVMFQFTHPVRGATTMPAYSCLTTGVSIHAPRAGCDAHIAPISATQDAFQFTHPVRGATPQTAQWRVRNTGFNSRTPCGVRHASHLSRRISWRSFNSRTPCGVRRTP